MKFKDLFNTHMLHIWYIYLHLGDLCWANVGKYSSTMKHMGNCNYYNYYFTMVHGASIKMN